MIKNEQLGRNILKKDSVFTSRELKPNVWLVELHAGPRAHILRYVVVDLAQADTKGVVQYEIGSVGKPRYGTRTMRFNQGYRPQGSGFSGLMDAPASADNILVEQLVDWVERYHR